jgi:hypothetical protein
VTPPQVVALGRAAADNPTVCSRVSDRGDLITAGPQSPVQFARATMGRLGLASERTLEAYEALFHRGDEAAFPVLMAGSGAE